jgi:uncharacterized sulfatase
MLCSSILAQTNEIKKNLPNILFFIADDCTFRDLDSYGGVNVVTPNIDKLANEGMQFMRCFQPTSMCTPARSCLYTGLYPVRNGAYPNHSHVNAGTKSIFHYLKPAGYRVALLGKQHISPPESFPFDFLGDPGDDLNFNAMDDFLAETKRQDQPFCLFVCSHQPHFPHTKGDTLKFDPKQIQLPPYYVDSKEMRSKFVKYLAEIIYMDEEVGKCLELLKKFNLTENTVVVFTSENGNNFPFAKWTCYDNGLQTAFIVRWPGKVKAGSKTKAMVEYVDVTPTLIEICRGKVPSNLDGKSFLPVLLGEKTTHKNYTYGIQTSRGIDRGPEYYGIRTIRSDTFRYIYNLTPEASFQCTFTRGNLFKSWIAKADTDTIAKFIVNRYQHRPAEELYNIINDPYEQHNIISDPNNAQTVQQLRKKLMRWMSQQGDNGQATEMKAYERQNNGKNQKPVTD